MIDEVKSDVSQIKEHLEKYNWKFEEVQDRKSGVEDRVTELEVRTDVDQLRKSMNTSMS